MSGLVSAQARCATVTTVAYPGMSVVNLVFNKELPFRSPDKGLTVNALSANVNVLGLAALNAIVASSESDIGTCP
jgi:hypothetical protein